MKSPNILKGLLVSILAASLSHASQVPCANNKPCGPSGTEDCGDCDEGEGANPFYPNGGNVARHVRNSVHWPTAGAALSVFSEVKLA